MNKYLKSFLIFATICLFLFTVLVGIGYNSYKNIEAKMTKAGFTDIHIYSSNNKVLYPGNMTGHLAKATIENEEHYPLCGNISGDVVTGKWND